VVGCIAAAGERREEKKYESATTSTLLWEEKGNHMPHFLNQLLPISLVSKYGKWGKSLIT